MKTLKQKILEEMVVNYEPLWELAKEIEREYRERFKNPRTGLSEIYNRLVELQKERG